MKATPLLAIAAIGWLLTASPAPGAQAAPPLPAAPFDAELYSLGYDVFLANNNPGDAFAVAQMALAAHPDDPVWRKRAARSGEWSGHPVQALDSWYYLATTTADREAREQAVRLARELRDYRKLKQLLGPELVAGGARELREYVAICEAQGMPEDAIAVLETRRNGADSAYALEQLARLQEAAGNPEKSVAAWLDLATTQGVTADILLKAASLSHGMGDIRSTYYTILKLGQQKIAPQETAYWQTVSDLAWAMQDTDGAVAASEVLIGQGHGRNEDYQRLVSACRFTDPVKAYGAALAGWQRSKSPDFFLALLEIGLDLQRQAELLTLVRVAEQSGSLKPLEGYPNYWMLVSQLQLAVGNREAAVRYYREALARFRGNEQLEAGYIWLLIDLDRRQELRRVLLAWNGRQVEHPVLYEPFGAAYVYLGEYQRALPLYRVRYGAMQGNPAWLASYAEVLDQTGSPEAAFQERLRALLLTRSRLAAGYSLGDKARKALLRDYARLSQSVLPGDGLTALMANLIRGKQDDGGRELVAAWALSSGRNDFARLWYWQEYARMTRRPEWVELALALEANDHDRIARLMRRDVERFSYRDAIEALGRIGRTGAAESLAFDTFQRNDRDNLLDRQVRELFSAHPGSVAYGISVMDQAGVGFLEQRLSLVQPLTPRFSLLVNAGNTNISHLKDGILGVYPSSAQSAAAGISLRHDRGRAEAMVGFYDGLAPRATATVRTDWRLTGTASLDMALNLGAEASETVLLKVGGQKDEVAVGFRGALTPRDGLMVRGTARSLRDQDRHELGQGASLESELNHRLLADWPDTTLRLFGGYHYYARTGTPTGKALSLIPGQVADASYYVPLSFGQTGFGLAVGEDGRSSYTRRWLPFGSADVNWNSTSSYGFRYEVGVVGPVFGLDKLELVFSQENSTFGTSEMISRFDLHYRYQFE